MNPQFLLCRWQPEGQRPTASGQTPSRSSGTRPRVEEARVRSIPKCLKRGRRSTSCIWGCVRVAEAAFRAHTHTHTHSLTDTLTLTLHTHTHFHSHSHSLTHSLARLLTHSLTRSFARSLAHSPTHSLARLLACSLAHSPTHSLTHPLTHSLTHHFGSCLKKLDVVEHAALARWKHFGLAVLTSSQAQHFVHLGVCSCGRGSISCYQGPAVWEKQCIYIYICLKNYIPSSWATQYRISRPLGRGCEGRVVKGH